MSNEEFLDVRVRVGDFKKKSRKVHEGVRKKYDFDSRCSREADRNIRSGDYQVVINIRTFLLVT